MSNVWGEETYKKTIKLFCFLPIYKFKRSAKKKVWKICGVPVFKIKRKGDGRVLKYYFCGVRFLTAKIKQG